MRKNKYAHLRAYHVMPLDFVSFTEFDADSERSEDADFRKAYHWLEKRVGFYPLFLGFGNADAERLTGYSNQWAVNIGTEHRDGKLVNILRKKGEFPNHVLFVFDLESLSAPVFTDYMYWCCILNYCINDDEPMRSFVRGLFRKSFGRTDWLRLASRKPCDVQVVVPKLDLRKACEVWVRNKATKAKLEAMGFENVVVKRLPILERRDAVESARAA